MRATLAVIAVGLALAGCSLNSSPPPTTRSLAQDQQGAIQMQMGCQSDPNPKACNDRIGQTYSQDTAQLKSDELALQVAQDQLRKDENG